MAAAEEQDARKATIAGTEVLKLLDGVDHLHASKGKTVIHVDLKKIRPDDATLRSLLIGPTGNLRAPTLRVGRTLLVGFDEAMYRQVLRVK